ncbi:MAG: c-type cytochrome [Sulfitobacter sp.]
MKKFFSVFFVCAQMLVTTTSAQADQDKNDPTQLAKSSGCFECHGSARALIGPAFSDIAARRVAEKTDGNALFQTIKNGGKGNWSELSKGVPMPPYSGSLTDAEIQSLVDWIIEFQK